MAVYTVQERNAWVGFHRPQSQAAIRLFCLPYSGAGASIFTSWRGILPSFIEVIPIELPGRGSRMAERPYTCLEPLVQDLAESLLPFLDKPFALFGHSLGALVSFEVSRRLRDRHGVLPTHLFVSAHTAPQIPDNDPAFHLLPDAELIVKLREMGGTQEEVLQNEELRGIILPLIRADFSICGGYTYRPEPALTCPIDAFGGLGDPYVSRLALEAWAVHTTGPFKARMFPGDHFFINTARPLLLRVIAQELLSAIPR